LQVAADDGVRDVHCFLPFSVRSGGFLAEAGQAGGVAGDDDDAD
jgi:hypothetical protein